MPRILVRPSILLAAGWLGALVTTTGCYSRLVASSTDLDSHPPAVQPAENAEADLAEARRLWTNYCTGAYKVCLSAWGTTFAWNVTLDVDRGEVLGRYDFVDDHGGRTAPAIDWTVDRMLDAIERDGRFRFQYDPTFGYPTAFTLGDPGTTFRVHWLQKPAPVLTARVPIRHGWCGTQMR